MIQVFNKCCYEM